jgi:hypothetical protein
LEFALRDQIGIRVNPEHLDGLADRLRQLLDDQDRWKEVIVRIRDRTIANFGHSGAVGGQYLVESIQKRIESRKKRGESTKTN